MKIPNPANILREAQLKTEKRAEASSLLRVRLGHAFKKENKEGRHAFVEKLKANGVTALDVKRLAEDATRDKGMLIKWERKAAQENKAATLADVKVRSAFSKILIIVRELHANDIAGDIPFDEAAEAVITLVLLHP